MVSTFDLQFHIIHTLDIGTHRYNICDWPKNDTKPITSGALVLLQLLNYDTEAAQRFKYEQRHTG